MEKENLILQFMKEKEYIPMKAKELAAIFSVKKADLQEFKNILSKMEHDGKIIKNRRNKYNINEIKTLVGTFRNSKSFGFVIPDNKKESNDIFISKKNFNGARDNYKVVVQITKPEEKGKKPEGKIIEIIGNINEAGIDMLSIIKEYKLPYEFPEQVIKEAKSIEKNVTLEEINNRRNFRDKEIFTIDGEDAKDLDDAVSVEKTKNGTYILSVHIADVSYYVKEGSFLDKEAIVRGTSVYMLDRVIPMLPKELSNGICSLNEGKDRLTLSVIMEIDNSGKVISSEVVKGVINVTKRMSYNMVQKLLELSENDKAPENVKQYIKYIPHFKLMEELAHILENRRKKQGYLDLDIPESKIILDQNGHAIDVTKYEIKFSNIIIEQFMLTANETIAEKFFWLEAPFIYRVHESPDQEKVTELNRYLYNFGYKIKGNKENIHPKAFSSILESIKGKDEEKVISNLILRTLKVARYEAQNKGHFGIAGKYYCHFTSPIRRYPDLYIHRIISEYLKHDYTIDENYKEKQKELAIKYADSSSEKEKNAQKAERDSEDLKKAEFMQDKIGEIYEGIVSGVTNFGLFVELENTVEGLIRFENLGNEYFNYDDVHKQLIGEQTGIIYKMGDKITIKVIEANKNLKKVAFAKYDVDNKSKEI